MSKACTASQALEDFEYWLGYKEKATSKYATFRGKEYFELDAGSNNFTYAGYVCGIQGGAWCAMQDSLVILEACGGDVSVARHVLHGVWPYARCDVLYEAAPAAYKGRRGSWQPKPGDVIVFTDDGKTRTHTGMVYAADGTYVYTFEGNSSNMCRKRSYLLTSNYIYGYVRPAYADGEPPIIPIEQYGELVLPDTGLHLLSKGCAGPEVKTVQRLLYSKGFKGADGKAITADGDFGKNTAYAVKAWQTELGLTSDGWVGKDTWPAFLTKAA